MIYGEIVRRAVLVAGIAVAAGGVAGCEEETPAEKLGEAIEEGGENLGEAVEKAGEKLEN